MKTPKISVEQFYVENASSLGLHLLAGADGLKRIIKEPTVNRPAWPWRVHQIFCEQTHSNHRFG